MRTRMRNPVAAAALAATVLLGGCNGERDARSPGTKTAAVTIRNDFHEGLLRLDDLQRGASLRGVIRRSGERCDRVEASAFQQDHENLKMWTARCQANAYAVYLAADGQVQVRQCSQAAQLGLPACRAAEGG